MKLTMPNELRAQLQKRWDNGSLLSSLVTQTPLFPLRLVLKCPNSEDIAQHFDTVRDWIAELRALSYCRVEMREFKHRVFGNNAVPQTVWVDSLDDAWAWLGKRREVAQFTQLIEQTHSRQPALLAWLAQRPLRALALVDDWSMLLDIVGWMQAHPHPDVYLRQVDLPSVHSKFIEAQRGVLMELLDMSLPAAAINPTATGMSQFTQRYGFRDKPLRIRLRVLDPDYALLPNRLAQDITLDAASFSQLNPKVTRVFITENEINFLAFPQVKGGMVIFGAGYGFDMLRGADWLNRCQIFYWGDIDTHGFAILNQLRGQFDHVQSLLMDRATLLAFASLWGEEASQTLRDLPRLNAAESALYNDLRDNRIRKNLRLEQERIAYGWVVAALSVISDQLG